MDETDHRVKGLPPSDVSAATGIVGLVALALCLGIARKWPALAEALGLPGPRAMLDGPHAAIAAMVVVALAMAAWALLAERVHRRPSTGIAAHRQRGFEAATTLTKLVGLWASWAIIAALYALLRWYWEPPYLFAMDLLKWAAAAMVAGSVPYLLWLDRRMIEPRDHAWHFGALITLQSGWDAGQIARHWRSWLIKAFFGAFMIAILPGNWANVIGADYAELFRQPAVFAGAIVNLLFLVDVLIGTVGYIMTLRPLDAHIRSGNPFLGGWVAALLCYPPFVWGILGNANVLNYEENVGGWAHWFGGYAPLAWGWAGLLVLLTAIYAWATVAFGLRFSNLTYRGVVTNGPYRFTRHPAYVSKNLFWWCSVLPFLVTSGAPWDAVRNCFCLLCVNAIYYWRARTEEAHLLREDPKYAEYHAWMAANGPVTARLGRLGTAITAPFRRRKASPADAVRP